jgi:hypothetical protein
MTSKQVPTTDVVRKMRAPQKEFAVEFYRWALKDAEREFSNGFPFLRRIKYTAVTDYLEFVNALSPSKKQPFQVGMVKRSHREGAFLADDGLTMEEQTLTEHYLNRNKDHDPLLGSVRVLSRAEQKRVKELSAGETKYQIDRKGLRASLKEKLAPILGDSIEKLGSNALWRYSTPIGKWTVETWLDTGTRLAQFSYSHTVSLRPEVRLVEGTSILAWLGIHSTSWDLLTDADIPAAAALVAEVSSHFLDAMSKLAGG